MEPDIVLRLLELAEPGTSFDDVGGREILKEAADHILAARACAEMMLQGTGQKICESMAMRVLDRQWISVEERLPEKGVDVLVASPCPNSNVPNIDIASWGSEGEQEPVWRESDCGRIYPTHWMPLPAPPQGGN